MKSKRVFKTLSFTLALAIIIQLVPMGIISAEETPQAPETTEQMIEDVSNEETGVNEREILYEVTDKRTENEKHYKMSDGSFSVAKYPEAIHYLDENEKWEDIDNTLDFEPAVEENVSGEYVNRSNYFDVRFSENTTDENLFTLSKDGSSSISVKLNEDNTQLSQAQTAGNGAALFSLQPEETMTTEEKNQRFLDKEKLSSEITYIDVLPDIDYQYVVLPNGIKENIIINKAKNEYIFNFGLDITGLELQEHEDGSLSLLSNGEVEYSIPAPFMFDASGKYSEAVHYEVTENSDGSVSLKIVADSNWINQEDIIFPVTVDPIINTNTEDVYIQDASGCKYIGSMMPDNTNDNYGSSTTLNTGYKRISAGNYMQSVAYIRWSNLPLLQNSDIVVSATLNYYQQSIDMSETVDRSEVFVEAHNVSSSWAENTLTWNNKPAYDTEILDYSTLSYDTNNKYVSWDITKAIRKWYLNWESDGVALVPASEYTTNSAALSSAETSKADQKPYILINYRSNKGIEEKWTYTSSDAGNAGQTFVNNYNGNMVLVRNDYTSPSSLMPFTINHVYNSYMAGKEFSSDTYSANTCSYFRMMAGQGWKLSIQESIVPVSILEWGVESKYAYIYNDEDGTDHYFYLNSNNKYVDEDGLGYTIEVSDTQYILNDGKGIKKTFKIINELRNHIMSANGYITKIEDQYGNKIEYTYSTQYPDRIVSIKDPSGTTATLNYDSTYHLSSIVIGDRTITYSYYKGHLNRIQDSYGYTSNYGYDNNNILCSASDQRGTQVNISFEKSSVETYRAASMTSKLSTSDTENGMDFSYPVSETSVTHYYGIDAQKNTADDIYTTYVFDNFGRPLITYNENGDKSCIYGINISEYADKGTLATFGSQNSNIAKLASSGIATNNLLADGSFEDTVLIGFECSNFTNNDFGLVTKESYVGSQSLECIIASNNSAVNGIKSTLSNLKSGKKYTLSAYVKCVGGTTGSLVLKASSGSNTYTSESISKTDSQIDNGWQRLSVDFTNASTTNINLGIVGGTGTFYIDGVQVEEANDYTPSNLNLANNSGFENSFVYWNTPAGSNVYPTSVASEVKFGNKALKIEGSNQLYCKAYQEINVGKFPKHSFIVSGWAKAASVSTSKNDKRKFELSATIKYKEKDEHGAETIKRNTEVFPFVWGTNDWQFVSGAINLPTPKPNSKITEIVSVTIGAEYSCNANTAIFDNITLTRGSVTNIEYDAFGNANTIVVDGNSVYYSEYNADGELLKIVDRLKNELLREYIYEGDKLVAIKDKDGNIIRTNEYDSNNNLTRKIDANGNEKTYTYNSFGQVTSMTSPEMSQVNTYSSYGRPLSQSVTKTINGEQKTMTTSSQYDETTKTLLSSTDESGSTNSFTYDSNHNLTSSINGKGEKLSYQYKANGDIEKVYVDENNNGICDNNETALQYQYDSNGSLTKIGSKTGEYNFIYNNANSLDQVKIGSSMISKKIYNSTNTTVTGEEFGNGFTLGYTYDLLGNLTGVKQNNELNFSYRYNNSQKLTEHKDMISNITHKYLYDGEDNLFYYLQQKPSYLYKSFYAKQDDGSTAAIQDINGTEIKYSSGTDTKTVDGETVKKEQFKIGDFLKIENDSDAFGRPTEKRFILNQESGNIKYNYTYANGAEANSTTNRVSKFSYTIGSNSSNDTSYTYDALGNITSIKQKPIVPVETYEYDSKGQLIRNDSLLKNRTIVYEYDANGNILSKKTYSYSYSGQLGTPDKTDSYTYGDAEWGDKLTAVNGKTLSYDAIGNPTQYYNPDIGGYYSIQWQGSMPSYIFMKDSNNNFGTSTCTYRYNADGMRTSKTVNGTTTEFILDGKKVVATLRSGKLVCFLYDDNGSVIGMAYPDSNGNITDDNRYYFVKNYQGDIIQIIDSTGETQVTYSYDVWGKVDSASGDQTLLDDNIFGYRGYIYDKETRLYYLQSRYYDPANGRFLNADCQINQDVLGTNNFAYCSNNPVMYKDPAGNVSAFISYDKHFSEQTDFIIKTFYDKDDYHIVFNVRTAADFIKSWNTLASMLSVADGDLEDIHIVTHGGPGIIYLDESDLSYGAGEYTETNDTLRKLERIYLTGMVYLYSCQGGTQYNGSSVAAELCQKTFGHEVRAAVDGYVHYRDWYQIWDRYPIVKHQNDWNSHWSDFGTASSNGWQIRVTHHWNVRAIGPLPVHLLAANKIIMNYHEPFSFPMGFWGKEHLLKNH